VRRGFVQFAVLKGYPFTMHRSESTDAAINIQSLHGGTAYSSDVGGRDGGASALPMGGGGAAAGGDAKAISDPEAPGTAPKKQKWKRPQLRGLSSETRHKLLLRGFPVRFLACRACSRMKPLRQGVDGVPVAT